MVKVFKKGFNRFADVGKTIDRRNKNEIFENIFARICNSFCNFNNRKNNNENK
jgi:hypothetical protein